MGGDSVAETWLEVRELGCERDHRRLFENVSFSATPGEVVQVAGPNGSGKTTLLRFLAGISQAYEGEILWRGEPITAVAPQYRGQMLFFGHAPGVTLNLTALENLQWYFSLNQQVTRESLYSALAAVGLAGYEEVPAYRMSAGQQRRIALARLRLSRVPLWILDEPFTAIDRAGVTELEGLLAAHASAGGMVILTTHHPLNLDTPYSRIELECANAG